METNELNRVDASRLESGYTGQGELLRDLMAWVDLHLYYYYSHQWLGPSSEMKNLLGLVVTREEFEHNLTKAAQRGLPTELTDEEREQISLSLSAIRLRLERTDAQIPLLELFRRFELDEFEKKCVVLAYLPEIDLKYTKLFAYLQDDMTRKAAGVSLSCELFLPEGAELAACISRFRGSGGFVRLFDPAELDRGMLVLRHPVVEFLANGTLREGGDFRLFDGSGREKRDPLIIQETYARQLDAAFSFAGKCCIRLSGPQGSGKRFQVEHLMARYRERCVFSDLEGDDWRTRAQNAALAADLTDAYLCLYHLDRKDETGQTVPPPQSMLEELERLELHREKRFFLSQLASPMRLRTLTVELELPVASETERLMMFDSCLRDVKLSGCTTEELAAKFRFSPRQIRIACEQAVGLARLDGAGEISGALIHRCCYRQAVHKLGELATQVTPGYTWDDVVLPVAQ